MRGCALFEPIGRYCQDDRPRPAPSIFKQHSFFEFAPAREAFLEIDAAAINDVSLFRVRSSGHTVALDEPSNLSIIVPREGKLAIESGQTSHLVKPGSLLLLPPDSRITRTIPGTMGVFRADLVLFRPPARGGAHGPPSRLAGLEKLLAPHSGNEHEQGLRYLANVLLTADSRLEPSPKRERVLKAAAFMLEDLLGAIIEQLGGDDPTLASPSPADRRLATRGADYLLRHLDEPFSGRRLAEFLGVSERRTQIAFHRIHGQSPRAFLIERRLDRAHELLRNPSAAMSVTDVALACGFGNHGRFATAYARRFGLTPSEALRRSR